MCGFVCTCAVTKKNKNSSRSLCSLKSHAFVWCLTVAKVRLSGAFRPFVWPLELYKTKTHITDGRAKHNCVVCERGQSAASRGSFWSLELYKKKTHIIYARTTRSCVVCERGQSAASSLGRSTATSSMGNTPVSAKNKKLFKAVNEGNYKRALGLVFEKGAQVTTRSIDTLVQHLYRRTFYTHPHIYS